MSEETLLNMDEGTLRKLLEATLDLAERRRIRTAIRELRRQQLERDEEALASKRFRTERSAERQENKENLLRSRHLEEEQEQQKALDLLSGKLEAIHDVEELTALLRGASEYEERKLIRAAIRKLRDEEIKAATLAGKAYDNRRDPKEPLDAKGQGEKTLDRSVSEVQERAERELIRAQIRELRTQQHGDTKPLDGLDSSLGTFLLLDPAANPPPSESSSAPESDPDPPELSTEGPEATSHNSDSDSESRPPSKEESTSDPSAPEDAEVLRPGEGGPAGGTMEGRTDVPDAEQGVCSEEGPPSRLPSKEGAAEEDVPPVPVKEADATDKRGDVCIAAPSPVGPKRPAPLDAPCSGMGTPTPHSKGNADPPRDQPFQRTSSSIRERARKFSSEAPSPGSAPVPAPPKAEGAGRGAWILRQQPPPTPPTQLPRATDSPAEAGVSAGRAFQNGIKQRAGSAFGAGVGPSGRLTGSLAQAGTTVRPPAPASPKDGAVSVGGARTTNGGVAS
ncbi:hypothetical protein JRQ81_007623 [Phrynocephalus forsythii]|uniref:Smoothelin domain-containing protein n=1 Tax=Phrynocephalus forsythii TaxID=171643 RepID=A0A9Q0XCF3_9SAUR|nr:hypothetical protein JRQ81_007623 [Phrynocephalus forsythii]